MTYTEFRERVLPVLQAGWVDRVDSATKGVDEATETGEREAMMSGALLTLNALGLLDQVTLDTVTLLAKVGRLEVLLPNTLREMP